MPNKTEIDWQQIRYFTPNENWGDVDLMAPELIYKLDAMREYINTPVIISCGTQGQHSENSYHYKGEAVDVVVPSHKKSLFDLYLSAERFNWGGIGLYPHWTYRGHQCGGLHLDIRQDHGRWIGVKKGRSVLYHSLSLENLKDNNMC